MVGLETPQGASGLSVLGISKGFPGVQALDSVSFSLQRGEVHAILGENGAGKSTLLKILSGALQPDSGRILLDGEDIYLKTPKAASQIGIATIYQELSLIPWLSVAHNLFLGREWMVGRFLMSKTKLKQKAEEVFSALGLSLDPNAIAGDLGMAEQQLVEISRAFSRSARFILMDEPTASLTETEINLLFGKIETLKKAGVGILYISHRLEEIFRIADRVTVMRDGKSVYSGIAGELTLPELIARMVGRSIGNHYPKDSVEPGELLLEARDGASGAEGLSLSLRRGEVVGLAGLVGAGRTEWARKIFGADPDPTMRIKVSGTEVSVGSPRQGRDLGMGMVPENRKEHGLISGRSVLHNITITIIDWLSRLGIVDRKRQAAVSDEYIDKLSIKCSSDTVDVSTLSGGNQQKAVLAKWLARKGKIIILDEPTRGIDVGAKLEMYQQMNTLCREGKGIILISSDLPELLSMSDRLYVMHEGRFVATLSRQEASQEKILEYASGLNYSQINRNGSEGI
ncbi:MAG: sugar ABC transporter ATP-binding protein [Spirochaetia bacterium]|jgi:ABC-type sugar transport system ATPase subunit|nr:sugar ABC transporter ATP-binding protein [Spirochaetia bacterium]